MEAMAGLLFHALRSSRSRAALFGVALLLAGAGARRVLTRGGGLRFAAGGQAPPPGRAPGPGEVLRADLGTVAVGSIGEAVFTIRNDGTGLLRILDVEVGCGCLTPLYPKSLQPGAKGEIRVRFKPQPLWSGPMEKHLKVRTDDPRRREIDLTLAVRVSPLIAIDPPTPLMLQYHLGETIRREIRLVPREGSTVTFSRADSNSPLVKASVEGSRSDAAHPGRLRLEVGPLPGPGDVVVTVNVATSEPRIPLLPVVAVLMALEGPVVSPTRIAVASLGADEVGKELSPLTVATRASHLTLLGIDTGNPGIRAEPVEKGTLPGHAYAFVLRYAGGWKAGPVETTLRVRTDDPNFPEVKVPFRALVR